MTAPPASRQDFGALAWESGRSVHTKCMDCRWNRSTGAAEQAAYKHVRATGHSVMAAALTTHLIVPEHGRG